MRKSFVLCWLAVCLALPAAAQKSLSAVEILSLENPADVRLSPDGTQVLFEVSTADWKANRRVSHIWRVSVAGGEPVKMTNGSGETGPAWSPDGTRFAFTRRAGDRAQAFVQRLTGGEAEQFTRHETAVSQITFSRDGSRLYFVAPEKPSRPPRGLDDTYLFEQNRSNRHLWEIGLDRDARERRLTEGHFDVREFSLAPDGRSILYVAAPSPLLDDTVHAEIYRLELTTNKTERLTDNKVGENQPRTSPDGTQILFVAASDAALQDAYNQSALFAMPAAGGRPRLLLPEFRGEVLGAEWAERGILLLANTGVESQIYRAQPADGAPQPVTRGRHAVSQFHYSPGVDRWAAVISDPASPGDVWAGDRQLTALNPILKNAALGRAEPFRWKGKDGVEIEGTIVYPYGYEAGKGYPLVSEIHGGPRGSYKLSFTPMQFWAARGYAIFRPNYRGSSGYGNEFLRDLKGNYFRNSADDVLTGIDALIAAGVAEADHLGVLGWSAGGIMTNWLITQTNRFKAAASGAGVANWFSQFSQSDVRSHRGFWFGGDPWGENAPLDVYIKASAVFHTQRVTTPTLILVGERDERVPMPQSVEMYRALKRNGATVELMIFPREGHGLQELRHRLARMNKEYGWFEKYIRGAEYTPEPPPKSEEKPDEASK